MLGGGIGGVCYEDSCYGYFVCWNDTISFAYLVWILHYCALFVWIIG